MTMSTDSNLEGITHGNTKIIVSDDLSYAELPKDRLETIYELVAGPGTSTVGVALIVRNRQQNALPGILRGISTLPSNAPLEDVINTVNQIVLNAREAQLMSAQVITDIPAQGNCRQPDGPRGVSNRPGF